MGRAIVREPQAFLMDEPLSNLDAKLRVSMRAQLSRLHERLGVTTVYVTHDQVEAMTLGQRVAVMRGGVLQQCDTPEQLFDHPANLFVAAFIGSPAMNLVEAEAGRFGTCQVASPVEGRCILGMRPHDLKLGPGIPAVVQVVERLGTETNVVAGIDAPRLRAAALSDAVDATAADDDVLLAEDDRASLTVVLDARAPVAVGDRIELTDRPGPPAPLRHRDRRGAQSARRESRRANARWISRLRPIRARTASSSIVASTLTSAGTPWRVAPKMNSGNVCVWPALNDVIT